jgi:Protein of unknown function (DUF1254)
MGALPAGVKEIKAPTNMVWIIGRTQTNGPNDYAAVNALQQQYKLNPLSAFGTPYTTPAGVVDPEVDMKEGPADQLAKMDAATFFKTLARPMVDCIGCFVPASGSPPDARGRTMRVITRPKGDTGRFYAPERSESQEIQLDATHRKTQRFPRRSNSIE